MISCTKKVVEAPTDLNQFRTGDLFGEWKFIGYSDKKQPKFGTTIEFGKDETSKYRLNGRSSVNLYFASFETDDKKIFKVGVMGSTKIAGSTEANQFEAVYFDHLRSAERYEFINKDKLIFYLSNPKAK